MQHCDRRRFLILGGATLGAVVAGCARTGGAPADFTGEPPLDIGPASSYAPGVYDRWAKSSGFFVVHQGGRIVAVSSTCTHRKCSLAAAPSEITCDCHGSRFTPLGQVVTGPATVPLPRFGIRRTATGTLEVDRSKVFPSGQWDQAGAFVTV